jgi:hypothetical protein
MLCRAYGQLSTTIDTLAKQKRDIEDLKARMKKLEDALAV